MLEADPTLGSSRLCCVPPFLRQLFILSQQNNVCHSCSNDAFDAAMGVDAGKPESVVNLTGDRAGVLWAANGFLAAGLAAFVQALLVPVSNAGGREPKTLKPRSGRTPASLSSSVLRPLQQSPCCLPV